VRRERLSSRKADIGRIGRQQQKADIGRIGRQQQKADVGPIGCGQQKSGYRSLTLSRHSTIMACMSQFVPENRHLTRAFPAESEWIREDIPEK
jgi:hypothetical protein